MIIKITKSLDSIKKESRKGLLKGVIIMSKTISEGIVISLIVIGFMILA